MNYKKSFNEKALLNRCDYSIGISIAIRDENNKVNSGIFDPIILKGSKIPCIRSKTYYTLYDNQKSTEIKIYQGNSKYVDDNLLIGKFILKDIPKSPAGKERIELIFYYDFYGILHIKAKILSTGKIYRREINTFKIDKDIISFEDKINYDNWEKSKFSYLAKEIIIYCEERIKDLKPYEVKVMNNLLKDLKKALLIENEEMIRRYRDEIIYFLSEAS